MSFLQNISKRIDDLEHQDFEASEHTQFCSIMTSTTSALQRHGQDYFQKRKTELTFMGVSVSVSMGCLDDEWSLRLAARLKMCAINSGALSLLPWEALVLDGGKLEGVREACPVPAALFPMLDEPVLVLKRQTFFGGIGPCHCGTLGVACQSQILRPRAQD